MTECNLSRDGGRYKVLCKGHSGMCEAISVLTQTFECWCINNRHKISNYRIEKYSGYISIEFYGGRLSDVAFQMLVCGLLLLEHKEPSEVKVILDIS